MSEVSELLQKYLNPTLGTPKKHGGQLKWNCPRCDAGNKHNLEIRTSEIPASRFLKAHCWSCGLSGLRTILKEYGSEGWRQEPLFKSKNSFAKTEVIVEEDILELPNSCRSFTFNDEVYNYLINERKCLKQWLIERKVKYVYDKEDELYNHIIFPFYENNKLVCFTVQNFATKKYKNYGSSKFVAYKEFINPLLPITLTEGIYDCSSLPNSIPLLGTMLNKEVLLYCQGKNVILALDNNKELPESQKRKLQKELDKYGTNEVLIFDVGEYKDPNDYFIKNEQELKDNFKLIYNYFLKTDEK